MDATPQGNNGRAGTSRRGNGSRTAMPRQGNDGRAGAAYRSGSRRGNAPRSRFKRPPQPAPSGGVPLRTIILGIVALLLGLGIGMLLYPHIPFPGTEASLPGRTSVKEDELDTTLGTYSYDGKEVKVSIREAIEETMSLDAARNSDGSYEIPSVDAVISIARGRLLAEDAAKRGITANEEDALAYAKEVYKTTDTATIAASYGMDESRVKEMLKQSAVLKKLKEAVVQGQSSNEPEAPAAPEAGTEDEPKSTYAQYIMSLVGDEWDSNANTWARSDGPFHDQLKNYTISNTVATYSAAQAAYYVAYTQHAATQQQTATEWTSYVNQKLSNASVRLVSLVA